MKELVYDNGHGQPVTDSLRVAMKFNKQHKHVNESIRDLLRSAENSTDLEKREAIKCMFVEMTYLDDMNREQPMFIMTEGGFSLLAMGFTGQKAFEFKTDFLFEFQRRGKMLNDLVYNQLRIAQESAKQRLIKSNRVHEIDIIIKSMMKERGNLIKEINRIDRTDFFQLSIPDFDLSDAIRRKFLR